MMEKVEIVESGQKNDHAKVLGDWGDLISSRRGNGFRSNGRYVQRWRQSG